MLWPGQFAVPVFSSQLQLADHVEREANEQLACVHLQAVRQLQGPVKKSFPAGAE